MSRGLLSLLAVTCAVAVGNVYFPQAVSPLVAAGLGVSPDSAALVVTATQLGYTAGIFLLVPLGDRFPARRLVVTLLTVTGAALLAAACAPSLTYLAGASLLAGVATVVAQLVSPLAAGLAAPDRRGAVIGVLLSGSTGGMLLSRALAGVLGDRFGWRAPYLAAAAVALALAALLAFTLPRIAPGARRPYGRLLAEPLRLLLAEPELRRSAFYQATVFGAFSAVWTGVALLITGPEYGMGAGAAGTLALVGAATMVCTPLAGRLVDRRGPDRVNTVCLTGALAAAPVLAAGSLGGTAGLAALVAGTLLLDVAMQSGMTANSARVQALRADARARLTTAYMICAYLGGGAGSWLAARIHARAGWPGVCLLAAVLCALALARHLLHLARSRPAPPPGEAVPPSGEAAPPPGEAVPPPGETTPHPGEAAPPYRPRRSPRPGETPARRR
ncbi:MFS transporter [Bailinhaonella thermotolerans]|uniref:MFS transporter n=2 Tax=Bailinhaonella thermotolerans TaxID=1070861 RepID=A0A3A4ANP2_9ACTN|nr:MFS transporter [Bailinhaonella thermotolerans]